jgi:hypothetical protein
VASKKVQSRNKPSLAKGETGLKLKIVLIAVTAVLVVSLAANGNLYFLSQERDSLALNYNQQKQATAELQSQAAILQNQTVNLQNQVASLNDKANNLQTENSNLQNQNAALQKEIENLTASAANIPLNKPRLVTRLGVSNVIESAHGSNPRLFVEGDVFNTGGAVAWNARLLVTLFIKDRVAANVSLPLGNMEPFSGVHVSTNIQYNEVMLLTNWTIIPETNP